MFRNFRQEVTSSSHSGPAYAGLFFADAEPAFTYLRTPTVTGANGRFWPVLACQLWSASNQPKADIHVNHSKQVVDAHYGRFLPFGKVFSRYLRSLDQLLYRYPLFGLSDVLKLSLDNGIRLC